MTCEEIERDDVAEQYLLGRLSDADQERYEAHYFDCPACLERLRTLETVRGELSRDAVSGRSRRWMWRAAAGLAAAAVIVLAVRVVQDPDSSSPIDQSPAPTRPGDVILPPQASPPAPSPSPLSPLGAIDPPVYTPPRLRGVTTAAQREFGAAMDLYSARDYAGAITGLRRAIAADDTLLPARFYLAVSYLQTDRTADAVQELQKVVAAGESPYLEDARFFLAKARIREGDIAAARAELTRVVAMDGERREEAVRLLAQLP